MKETSNTLIYPNFPKELVKSQLHLDRYIKFIDSRPIRERIKFKTQYHHKIPDSLGGSNLGINKIHLIHREHYIAHLMLWKAFGGKMAYAFWLMTHDKYNYLSKLSSKQYSKLRVDQAKVTSERGVSLETRKKLSDAGKLRKDSKETIEKRASSNRGKKRSDKAKRNISQAKKDKMTLETRRK